MAKRKKQRPAAKPEPGATGVESTARPVEVVRPRAPDEPIAVVGLGASAGGVAVLQQFFAEMPVESGLAFVVVMHLSPDFDSQLASVIQHKTRMPVVQVNEAVEVRPNHVYVIPPSKQLTFTDGALQVMEPQQALGRRVTIDLFFRTLAFSYGQRAVGVILSGTDSDGVIGLKHVRAQGGLTIAQDPKEAEHPSMPTHAIETGMVDWVLPVAELAPRLMEFVRNENRMELPPEVASAEQPNVKELDAPGGPTVSIETRRERDELALGEVLVHLHEETGHNFEHYKRATLLRRVARRMQVNSVATLPDYLEYLRAHSAESAALLQDLLIGVTHFFRDPESFKTLEANIPQLFAGKSRTDRLRVWVPGCATGEEAYTIAMLLAEHSDRLDKPPHIQIFATDIDDQAIHDARHGLYPASIEADVPVERLRRFFVRQDQHYRVKKDLRDMILFASHNLLTDTPFSRIDLVSCRNLLIYLNGHAQEQAFDIFHFALRAGGMLFMGSAESAGSVQGLFSAVDPRQRLFVRRSVPRPYWKVPVLPPRLPSRVKVSSSRPATLPALARKSVEDTSGTTRESKIASQERRSVLFGELHLKLLEHYGPPSVLINEAHDIVHLSEHAGRYLSFRPGEPSTNLLHVVHPALRVELRTALFRAVQTHEPVVVSGHELTLDGRKEIIDLHVRPIQPEDSAHGFFLVLFETETAPLSAEATMSRNLAINRELDDELQFLKEQLHATVEQYEASSEELKASNEELQAMNEEMRSAAEELETGREELQSVNEELTTVNNELKEKVDELSHANADLQNLMFATDVGTIFLDREMRVKRFSPRVQEVFNLLPTDLGRPISDITHKLAYKNLLGDAQQVLKSLKTIEREVRLGEELWFLARISPYRTADDHIAGVVATFIDITRRKEAEVDKDKFVSLAENSTDFIGICDMNLVPNYVNPAAIRLVGLKNLAQLRRTNVREFFFPEDVDFIENTFFPRVLREGHAEAEIRFRHFETGEAIWMVYAVYAIKDQSGQPVGYATVSRNINARRLAEEALRESEERFRLLVEGAKDYAMFLLDSENVITFWSAGAERVFGWTQEEAIGESGAMIFTPQDRRKGEVEKELKTAQREGRALDRRFHLRKDGTRFWTDGVLMRIDDENGRPRSFAKVARDATDQRRIEDELAHARDELEQRVLERTRELVAMNTELERTMAQRQQLERELLEISEREKRRIGEDLHDMVCQELTATALFLKSNAKKLARENPEAAETLEQSAQTVNRNVVIARELAGGLQAIELTASGLKNALRDLALRACENSGIKCHFKCARGVRIPDDTAALHLYRVAQEAVNNAVKHSGAKNILVSLDRDSENVCVSVQDDGKGFVQRKRPKGLGLHMMRYRANALGGKLKIERRRSGGMDVTCVIPVKR